jgi:tetratricopeptide (TPR) repeat protein
MTARSAALVLVLGCACGGAQETVKRAPAAQKAAPPRLIEPPPAIMWKEAREMMGQGDWEGARARLDAYLAKEPKSAGGLFDAGWVAEKRGDAKAAGEFYRRAFTADPQHAGAALNLVRLLRAQDKDAEAEQVCRAALANRQESETRSAQLLDALAAVLRAQRKLDEAEAVVRKVLARHPRDADAYRNLAAIEADRGHVRLAELALNNARKLDDKDAGILNSLGLLSMKRDDVAAAREYFAAATRLDPGLAAAWANLGAIALSYRDYQAAEQAYAKAVQIDASRWETHLAHGWALEGLKKPKDALAEYDAVLSMKPAQEDALFGKALALKAEGDLPAALEAFKAYLMLPKAERAKEAQNQIAAIDLRLKNPPAAAQGVKPSAKPAAGLDLSKLPQGTDIDPSNDKLPTDEEMGPGAPGPAKAPEKEETPKAKVGLGSPASGLSERAAH